MKMLCVLNNKKKGRKALIMKQKTIILVKKCTKRRMK